jgi:Protein of unknown function (DUF1566)
VLFILLNTREFMQKSLSTICLVFVLLFAVSAIAADRVVVVPLGGKKPTGDAVAADVLEGKTFSNKDDVSIPGTMVNNGAKTFDPGTDDQNIPTGYHNGSGTVKGDPELTSANIKDGTTIFGVTGSHTGIGGNIQDTSSGDAVAGDILLNKKAWVEGVEVTGDVLAGVNIYGPDGSLSFTITDGLYSGNKTCTASDTKLASENIKADTSIFGYSGNSNVVNTSSGDAGVANIQFGKKAWVDGIEITGFLAGGTSCNPDATYSPLKRWVNNGNGTITDTTTGLIWYHKGNTYWGTYAQCSANVANISHLRPVDLTDGSSGFDWRLPTVNEMLKLTSGVEAISPSTQYLFSGIQTGWYWTCNASPNPIPLKHMRVQMPEVLGFGVEANLEVLYYALAVRNP